jgi:hypothetical protein
MKEFVEELQKELEKHLYEIFHNGINLEYHAKKVPETIRRIYLKNRQKAFDFLLEYISEFIEKLEKRMKMINSEFPEGCFLRFSYYSRILSPEEGEKILRYYKNYGEILNKKVEKMKSQNNCNLYELENTWEYVLFFQSLPFYLNIF